MVGGSPMQAVLVAPGVRDKKVLGFKRDVVKEKDGITRFIHSIIATNPAAKSAFYVFDLSKIVELFNTWRRGLKDVRPYYAVKCNPEPALLGALAALGAGFDCASRSEIEAVLALGVKPDSIVYANPCKPEAHIEYAATVGVNLTTYDSEEEVAKIKRCHPKCELLLRLKAPDDGEAKVNLGSKYGAHPEEVVPLLRAAQRAGLTVAGVSFHVGSGASRTDVYHGAIEAARAAFNTAVALGMPPMRILDLGGGFMAGATFEEATVVINTALMQYFGDMLGVEVIAEPGRYFAETAFTLATHIMGKRTRSEVREYWIDDGLYGSLNCILMDSYVPCPKPLACSSSEENVSCRGRTTHPSTVFGPTCDSLDTVVTGYQLPELHVGDWLLFHDMGAYTTASGSNFNGFATSDIMTYLAYSS